jgi:hypothetical protein
MSVSDYMDICEQLSREREEARDAAVTLSGKLGTAETRIAELEAEVQTARDAMDAMESMSTGMSPAVCRAMAKYWIGLADRMSPPDVVSLSRFECAMGCGRKFATTEVLGHHEEFCQGPKPRD